MDIGARIEFISDSGQFQAREIWAGSSFMSSESQWLGPASDAEEFIGLAAGQLHVLTEGADTAL